RWRPLYSHFVPAPLPATQRCIDEAGIGEAHRGQYEPSRQGANRGVANEQIEWPGRVEWRARLQIGRSQLEQPGRQEDQEHPDIVASQPATQCPPQRDAECGMAQVPRQALEPGFGPAFPPRPEELAEIV